MPETDSTYNLVNFRTSRTLASFFSPVRVSSGDGVIPVLLPGNRSYFPSFGAFKRPRVDSWVGDASLVRHMPFRAVRRKADVSST